MQIIRDRLTDKCEQDPRLLLEYIDEEERDELAVAAMTLTLYSSASERAESAHDRVTYIMDSAKDDYIAAHEASEELEYLQEMKEEAAELRADEMREERYFEKVTA